MNARLDRKLVVQLGAGLACDGCVAHGWGRTSHRDGYLMVTVDGRRRTASSVICELVNGPPPSPAHIARHLCGWSECIVGSHLGWGLPQDNARDRVEHGHTRTRAHVKPRVRKVIGAMAATGLIPHRDLAAQVGVSERTISTWAHQAA
jgi:hypothetical protein